MVDREQVEYELTEAERNLIAVSIELNDAVRTMPAILAGDPRTWRKFLEALKSLNHRWVAARAIIELDFQRIKDALE